MMIHEKHSATSYRKVVVIPEDTGPCHPSLPLFTVSNQSITEKRERDAVRLIDIQRLGVILRKDILIALISTLGFIGCDSVSSFAGQGRIKSLDPMNEWSDYQEVCASFGPEWHFTDFFFFQIMQHIHLQHLLSTHKHQAREQTKV